MSIETPLGRIYFSNENSSEFSYKFFQDGYLYLDYPDCSEDDVGSKFDACDQLLQIYEKTTKLYIDSDFFFSLKEIGHKFKNLRHLTIEGTRFWSLSINQIPQTVEFFDFSQNNNLHMPLLLKGVNDHPNLKTLIFDLNNFETNPGDMFLPEYLPQTSSQFNTSTFPKLEHVKLLKMRYHDDGVDEYNLENIRSLFPENEITFDIECIEEDFFEMTIKIVN